MTPDAQDQDGARRVLIVEDEANILEAISFVLSRAGFDVRGHGKGDTALAEVARFQPDLLVLDMMLPGRSGLEVLHDLRALPAHLPVLMLTAKGQAKDRDDALAAGADAFLSKPFSNAELLSEITRLLPQGARSTGPAGG